MTEAKDETLIAEKEPILRVSAGSNPQAVASAIAHSIYDTRTCKLRAVGAGAVNQATKAIVTSAGIRVFRGIYTVRIQMQQGRGTASYWAA